MSLIADLLVSNSKGAEFPTGHGGSWARNTKKHRCTVALNTHFDSARFNRIKRKYQIAPAWQLRTYQLFLSEDLLVVGGVRGVRGDRAG